MPTEDTIINNTKEGKMSPKFSIITVTYNAGEHIAVTAGSVAEQSYPNIEYIIIDGLSRDNTLAQVREIAPKAIIRSERDRGLYDAMNKGLRLATGDYIWFLNAGDSLPSPDIVQNLCKMITKDGNNHIWPDLIYGDTLLVDAKGESMGLRKLRPPAELRWQDFSNGMLVCHQAFIPKRLAVTQFSLKYRFSSDYDWCIRIIQNARSNFNSNMVIAHYLNEGGVTKENHFKSLLERFKIMKQHFGLKTSIAKHILFLFKRTR